ncbi:MAG: hypothetical protein M3Y42_10050 [Actinomycetota bacterium]|nr:hypothetical protein [Actinomycetota bacterium]
MTSVLRPQGDDPELLISPAFGVLDDGLARRMKAFSCTQPLHDLDVRKSRLDWADASVYQMAQIAFQIIDQVTVAMDFDRGASHGQVVARTVSFIAAQAPDRTRSEHERVAQWVLESLINVGTQDRGFTALYGLFNEQGRYERRTWQFKLLLELFAPDGTVYLRTTDEAINVLIGALDTDVESAQVAAETKLANLIQRGKLSEAQGVAEHARLRTIQYVETLRRKLDATRRDVRSVDWDREVPDLIEEALSHVEARFVAENAILTNITRARDDSDDPIRKRKAAYLVRIVRECIRRHTVLQARLQTAGATFRSEQDRQQFSGPARKATVDLFGQLLLPTLGLPITDAAQVTGVYFRAGTGLRLPGVIRLDGLVSMLLIPPVERDDLLDEILEPDLVQAEDPAVFTDDQWQQARAMLAALDRTPRRLSGLLAEARSVDPGLPHLLALHAVHALDPNVTSALHQGDRRVLLAVDDSTVLTDPEFGGADLLLVRADLDPTAPAATVPAQARDDSARGDTGP